MNTILSPLNVPNESTGEYFTDQLLVGLLQWIKLEGYIGCGTLAKHVLLYHFVEHRITDFTF